jgi:hypothetical protein
MSRPPRSPPRKPSEIIKKAIPRMHYPKLNTSITRKAYVYYEPELPQQIGRFQIYDHPELDRYENREPIQVTEPLELPRTHNIGRFHVTESIELPKTHTIGRFQIIEPIELAGRKSKGRGSKKDWYKEKPNYHKRTVMLKRCGRKSFKPR